MKTKKLFKVNLYHTLGSFNKTGSERHKNKREEINFVHGTKHACIKEQKKKKFDYKCNHNMK